MSQRQSWKRGFERVGPAPRHDPDAELEALAAPPGLAGDRKH
jgi:hypothetical protein